MQGVIVTPSGDANVVLSQYVCSDMHLSPDVALTGNDLDYWQFKTFCSFYGLSDHPWAIMVQGILMDRSRAKAMAKGSILERAASCCKDDTLQYVRIGRDSAASVRQAKAQDDARSPNDLTDQVGDLSSSGAVPKGGPGCHEAAEDQHHQADVRDGVDLSPLPIVSADLNGEILDE